MIVKVVRRGPPVVLEKQLHLEGRLGIWFEARSILGGRSFRVATDHFQRVLCEMEALAWVAR